MSNLLSMNYPAGSPERQYFQLIEKISGDLLIDKESADEVQAAIRFLEDCNVVFVDGTTVGPGGVHATLPEIAEFVLWIADVDDDESYWVTLAMRSPSVEVREIRDSIIQKIGSREDVCEVR